MRGEPGAREDDDASGDDAEVVITTAVVDAADLHHLQPAPRRAVHRRQPLEDDDAVRHAVELQIVDLRRPVVEEERGDVPVGKELFEGQDLPAIAQRALREQANLRQGVEHDPLRLLPLDDAEEALDRLPQLDLGGMEERQILFLGEHLFTDELLVDGDRVERPAVRASHGVELLDALGEGEIKPLLSLLRTFEQELQGQGGLAGPWITLDQKDVILRKAASQYFIEPWNPGAGVMRSFLRCGAFSLSHNDCEWSFTLRPRPSP